MLRADRRVVVSHVGSLVRPPAMIPYLEKIRDKEPYDEAAFEKCLTDSVAEAVRVQAEAGIDVVSDGEYGKSVNWAFYVHRRLSGLTWRPYTAEEAKDPTANSISTIARVTLTKLSFGRSSSIGRIRHKTPETPRDRGRQ